MRLSHILYKVDNLDKAVKQFKELGFEVVYGSNPKKAHNAIIWFEEGPFIELFTFNQNRAVMTMLNLFLKLKKKSGLLHRIHLYNSAPLGFCDFSLETDSRELTPWVEQMKNKGYIYDRMTSRRTNHKGEKLDWQLAVPPSKTLPFLMSAYNIPQRPSNVQHKNGAKCVRKLIYETSESNQKLIKELTQDDRIELKNGKGHIDVEIEGWDHPLFHKVAK